MRKDIYTLPTIEFVAGQSNTFRWRLWTQGKRPFNAENCRGNFAILDYSDQDAEEPLVSKDLSFQADGSDDVINSATVELQPSDTIELQGRYIYQITIVDQFGNSEIPNQGIMFIAHNINSRYLTD